MSSFLLQIIIALYLPYTAYSDAVTCSSLSPGNICIIECLGEEACEEATISCMDGYPCYINCNGDAACDDTTVNLGTATTVTIDCSANNINCEGMTAYGQNTQNMHIYCNSTVNACNSANFYCGTESCQLQCGPASCSNTDIDASLSNTYSCSGDCDDVTTVTPPPNTPQPTTTTTTRMPTISPTTAPTTHPTAEPTSKPTKSPTIIPTSIPSPNPSINPSVPPTTVTPTTSTTMTNINSPTSSSPSTSTTDIPTSNAPTTNRPTSKSPTTSTTDTPTSSSPSTLNPTLSTAITTSSSSIGTTERPLFHYIDCNGDDKCTSENKLCPNNIDCIIECIGNNACQQANITCPMNRNCILKCGGGGDDCKELSINGKESVSLDITCDNGAESCDRMNVYCPIIINNGGIGCSISGLNGNNVDSVIHLYAVKGLNDINITDDGGKQGSTVVAIHILCTEDYSKECYITGTNIFNSCINGDEICSTYNIATTPSPTKTPTTQYHYIDCNGDDECRSQYKVCPNHMECIIDCIGFNACQEVNISCPMNAHCQLNCGGHDDDCKELNIYAKQSISLDITCGNGGESCDRMRVYCPINNNGDGGCSISGLNGNNVDSIIYLYAVGGLNDINISDDGGKEGSMVKSVQIFCTEDYSKDCYIKETNVFDVCMSGDGICGKYTTNKPTINDVITPRPTARPSVNDRKNAESSGFEINTDNMMVMIILVLILVIVLLICCCLSLMQCVGVKCGVFYMIYVVLLRIIDVMTDIILSDRIVTYAMGNKFNSNILLIIAFGSVICIVVTYTIGLISMYWIYNTPTDTASVRPQQWFKKYIIAFILFFLLTNDTYLLIELFSSGLCGSDIFDSGHTIIEKQQIKIFKILSIIFGNVPQIVIQCIFGWIIYYEHEFQLEAIIIFLLSLSIISSIFVIITFIRLSMKNGKFDKKEHNLIVYQLKVKLIKSRRCKNSKKHQLLQIKKHRGSKRALREEIALILGIKKNILQIGHIEMDQDGCFINLVQRIPKTTDDHQYVESLYKNRAFSEIIEDIFHLEWNVAVKLVLNKTTEINKQITLEQIELALSWNDTNNNNDDDDEVNDGFLSDEQLNDIFDVIDDGKKKNNHDTMPSTDIITTNVIQIDNASQAALNGNEFDTQSISLQFNNKNKNNKQYHLQVIPSKSTASVASPLSAANNRNYAEQHYHELFKMVDNPSNSSNNKYDGNKKLKKEIQDIYDDNNDDAHSDIYNDDEDIDDDVNNMDNMKDNNIYDDDMDDMDDMDDDEGTNSNDTEHEDDENTDSYDEHTDDDDDGDDIDNDTYNDDTDTVEYDDEYYDEDQAENENEDEDEDENEDEDRYYDCNKNKGDIDTQSHYTDSTVTTIISSTTTTTTTARTATTRSTTHASGDCSQYSPYSGKQKGKGKSIKYIHPFNAQHNNDKFNPYNQWIKDNNDNKSENTVIFKGNVESQSKRRRKKRGVKGF